MPTGGARPAGQHRLDIAAATGTTPRLTAGHDGVIVADVVAEWAERHGTDFELTLTGPAAVSPVADDVPIPPRCCDESAGHDRQTRAKA